MIPIINEFLIDKPVSRSYTAVKNYLIINGESNFYTIQYNVFEKIIVEYDFLLPKTGDLKLDM